MASAVAGIGRSNQYDKSERVGSFWTPTIMSLASGNWVRNKAGGPAPWGSRSVMQSVPGPSYFSRTAKASPIRRADAAPISITRGRAASREGQDRLGGPRRVRERMSRLLRRPGHFLCRQHEGRGPHLSTDLDRYLRKGCAKLYDRKTPITAAEILNDRVP
jgi:hypothetical protein